MVYGLELSPDMVSQALASYPKKDNPNLVLIEGAAQQAGDILQPLLAPAGSEQTARPIRLVISNYTLHWVREPEHSAKFLLKQMFCALNPLQPIGGEQRHFCAHKDAFKELFEAGYRLIREDRRWDSYFQIRAGDHSEQGEWRHPPLITEDGIIEALTAAGYSGTPTLHEDEHRRTVIWRNHSSNSFTSFLLNTDLYSHLGQVALHRYQGAWQQKVVSPVH
jgi:hypothetical protein